MSNAQRQAVQAIRDAMTAGGPVHPGEVAGLVLAALDGEPERPERALAVAVALAGVLREEAEAGGLPGDTFGALQPLALQLVADVAGLMTALERDG